MYKSKKMFKGLNFMALLYRTIHTIVIHRWLIFTILLFAIPQFLPFSDSLFSTFAVQLFTIQLLYLWLFALQVFAILLFYALLTPNPSGSDLHESSTGPEHHLGPSGMQLWRGGGSGTTTGARTGINILTHTHTQYNHMI